MATKHIVSGKKFKGYDFRFIFYIFGFCFIDFSFLTGITKAQYLAAAKKGTSLSFMCADCQERDFHSRNVDRTENDDSEDDEDDVCFFVSSQFLITLLDEY